MTASQYDSFIFLIESLIIFFVNKGVQRVQGVQGVIMKWYRNSLEIVYAINFFATQYPCTPPPVLLTHFPSFLP